jgi:methionyl-tRNA formyltransferase
MLCKKTLFCEYAIKILKSYFSNDSLAIIKGNAGTKIDEELHWHKPTYLISFLSPWIIPVSLLDSAQKAAINFHPGSPRYPGSGCYNFALYEQAQQYGVTCHHMREQVDTGDIIMTSYFKISPNETVESLKLKSMNHLLFIFDKIICGIYENDFLPISEEKWLHPPYTKRLLDDLCKIDPRTMNKEEICLRVRSTCYSSFHERAYIEIEGERFYAQSSADEPVV